MSENISSNTTEFLQHYFFFGKIFPERVAMSLEGKMDDGREHVIIPLYKYIKEDDLDIDGKLTVFLNNSQITAHFSCKRQVKDVLILRDYIEESIRLLVDIKGYTSGCGLDIEITSLIDQIDNHWVFGTNFGAEIVNPIDQFEKKRPVDFDGIIRVLSPENETFLRFALSDLRQAIRNPKDTGFFCYRAIESLRNFIAKKYNLNPDTHRQESWKKFRDELFIDKGDIIFIKEFADPIRHGNSIYIPREKRIKILNLTWSMVDKFVLYIRHGYKKSENSSSNGLIR